MEPITRATLMAAEELIAYIFEGSTHRLAGEFRSWVDLSAPFKAFAWKYRDKIRKKVRGTKCDDEDLKDLRYELETAYTILKDCSFVDLEYERCGTRKRGPDFTVTYRTGTRFNVEVKRIRPAINQGCFDEWIANLRNQICAIPSELTFFIDIDPAWTIDELDISRSLLDPLVEGTPHIVKYIADTIGAAGPCIPTDEGKMYTVPGFEAIRFRLGKPSHKPMGGYTQWYGSSFRLFVTQEEYCQFVNAVCGKLGQMIPGEINILAISSDSRTHDDLVFRRALAKLRDLVEHKRDDFFKNRNFAGADDFAEKMKLLSSILFRGAWLSDPDRPNLLWCNEIAECSIPEDIGEALGRMS